jgi:hypothetical protein
MPGSGVNWANGLFRVYVVLWALWACAAAVPAVQGTGEVWERVTEYRSLGGDGREWVPKTARSIEADTPMPSNENIFDATFRRDSIAAAEMRWEALRGDYDVRRPVLRTGMIWGAWVIFAAIAPGLLLLVVRWIAAGFASKRGESR